MYSIERFGSWLVLKKYELVVKKLQCSRSQVGLRGVAVVVHVRDETASRRMSYRVISVINQEYEALSLHGGLGGGVE